MSRRGALLFAAMGVIWGVPYLMIRVAVRDLSPATLVCLRTAISALVLLPLAASRSELRPALARWRPVALFAAIEIALPWLLLGSAEEQLSSSLTALLLAGTPLAGALIALATGHDRIGRANAAGLAIGIAGVAAIVGLDLGSATGGALAEMAAVAVCYAVGPLILARYLGGVPGLGVIALSVALTALAYAPAAALNLPSRMPGLDVAGSVLGLALACTAVGFVLFFALIDEIGPLRATVITYVNPAVATIVGIAILNESLTAGMAIGFVLVIAGSVLATRAEPERATIGGELPEVSPG